MSKCLYRGCRDEPEMTKDELITNQYQFLKKMIPNDLAKLILFEFCHCKSQVRLENEKVHYTELKPGNYFFSIGCEKHRCRRDGCMMIRHDIYRVNNNNALSNSDLAINKFCIYCQNEMKCEAEDCGDFPSIFLERNGNFIDFDRDGIYDPRIHRMRCDNHMCIVYKKTNALLYIGHNVVSEIRCRRLPVYKGGMCLEHDKEFGYSGFH